MRSALLSVVAAFLIVCVMLAQPRVATAYTPDSAEVQAMVKRAVRFIETHASGGHYSRLGGTCLVGLTMYKHYGDADHPLVEAAVARCLSVREKGVSRFDSNYSVGIAIIFLSEVGPVAYRAEIETLLQALIDRQKPNGGWGYADHATGDTSQTQYAVLGLWMAKRANIEVDSEVVEGVCSWLMRTQARNGSWGYQGRDPGNFERIKQGKETLSLAAAGLGSTYVCADMLGLSERDDPSVKLPPAIRLVLSEEDKARLKRTSVSAPVLNRATQDGNGWFDRNFNIQAREYQHYYMYALERYKSFQERAENVTEEEPSWYNVGVEYLQETQAVDGSWRSCEAGPVLDSSFAVLFLLRSTKTSLWDGILTGPTTRREKDVLKQLLNDPDLDLQEILPDLEGVSKRLIRENPQALARLRRIAVGGPFEERKLAVETLSTIRDVDNVPTLIFALSDPDYRVAKAARDGLRFVSRKMDGFGMPEKPTKREYEAATVKWSEWYFTVRPDGELIK
jgi:hypothetical protein